MGVGDLRQPALRDDFNAAEWAQHKFRDYDGRFVASGRGHRATWAIFNTTPLEASKTGGAAFFKASEASALTKADLRNLVEEKDDLIREMAMFGSDIPTTPMYWKRQTTQLEWIVRQMSWAPPWTDTAVAADETVKKSDAIPVSAEAQPEPPLEPVPVSSGHSASDALVNPRELWSTVPP